MISVYVQKTLATAKSDTPLTSGSVGTVVQFYFSSDWDGLNRTAVFETSAYQKETAELSADNSAVIPESVMAQDGVTLFIGVYGTNGGGSIVVPTVYANCGEIKTGANTEPGGEPVTPSQAQQLQNQIDDLDDRVDALEAGGGGGSGGGAVTSVNGQTGAVVLTASDVGALPDTTPIPVVPAALPNPNKLTFIGAVSAEYDGSAAVSVEIPGGGGEKWKRIARIEVTEDAVSYFQINKDESGEAFSASDFTIRIKAVKRDSVSSLKIYKPNYYPDTTTPLLGTSTAIGQTNSFGNTGGDRYYTFQLIGEGDWRKVFFSESNADILSKTNNTYAVENDVYRSGVVYTVGNVEYPIDDIVLYATNGFFTGDIIEVWYK